MYKAGQWDAVGHGPSRQAAPTILTRSKQEQRSSSNSLLSSSLTSWRILLCKVSVSAKDNGVSWIICLSRAFQIGLFSPFLFYWLPAATFFPFSPLAFCQLKFYPRWPLHLFLPLAPFFCRLQLTDFTPSLPSEQRPLTSPNFSPPSSQSPLIPT